jgi:hypothetical protein
MPGAGALEQWMAQEAGLMGLVERQLEFDFLAHFAARLLVAQRFDRQQL